MHGLPAEKKKKKKRIKQKLKDKGNLKYQWDSPSLLRWPNTPYQVLSHTLRRLQTESIRWCLLRSFSSPKMQYVTDGVSRPKWMGWVWTDGRHPAGYVTDWRSLRHRLQALFGMAIAHKAENPGEEAQVVCQIKKQASGDGSTVGPFLSRIRVAGGSQPIATLPNHYAMHKTKAAEGLQKKKKKKK